MYPPTSISQWLRAVSECLGMLATRTQTERAPVVQESPQAESHLLVVWNHWVSMYRNGKFQGDIGKALRASATHLYLWSEMRQVGPTRHQPQRQQAQESSGPRNDQEPQGWFLMEDHGQGRRGIMVGALG